jgi:hypothetical protein
MSDNPQSNIVIMESEEMKQKFVAPSLTEDDAFLSNTASGTVVYRLPSPHALIGIPQHMLGLYSVMTFYIQIRAVFPEGI